MKKVLKCIIYAMLVVGSATGSLMLYKYHPETQLAFLIPGVLIFFYSIISDDLGVKRQLRFFRER